MTDIKPVAMATSSGIYVNDEGEALLMLLALKGGKEVLLYTADALRAAQVAKLREAAEKFKHDCDCGMPCDCYGPSTAKFQLLDMADELERSGK